jgi:hypothetical protein
MNDTPPPLPSPTPSLPAPYLAMGLGFLPSAMALLLITFSKGELDTSLLVLMCLVSVLCCFASSFQLFRRKTNRAILCAVLLMLLNSFISLAFGCGALFNTISFH